MGGYSLFNDAIIQFANNMCIFVCCMMSMIKLFGCNVKLLANKVIILSLVSCMLLSISDGIIGILYLNGYTVSGIVNCLPGIFGPIYFLSFVTIVNLRNSVLIEDNRMLTFTKVLTSLIVIVTVPFAVTNSMINEEDTTDQLLRTITNYSAILSGILIGVLNIVSDIYLLIYYHKYYFSSNSIMKHLRFQMLYRRNWIYFVLFLEVIEITCITTAILGIYPNTTMTFLGLVILLELNTMIDFVKFDTVRNEITIGDQTIYLFDDSKDEH